MPSKDVIYIESGSGIPFISFGSRAALNLVVHHTSILEAGSEEDCLERIEEFNREVIGQDVLEEIQELVSRMGFVTIEMVDPNMADADNYQNTFFDHKNTKALMEKWDE